MGPLRIAIAGGSIGGLTAGCLLRDAGHDVTVFERSTEELQQRGAGIGFLDASSRYLVQRAFVDIDKISITTDLIRYLGRDGRVVHQQAHRYRFSSWTTVYRELLSAFGSERYRLDHEMTDWSPIEGGVRVDFAQGASLEADLLISADGVGSRSRTKLQPGAVAAYAGYVAWRGMIHERDLPVSLAQKLTEAITYHVLANSHILVYPIPGPDGSVTPGDRLINVVWYRNYSKGPDLDDLLTDKDGVLRQISVPPGKMAAHHVEEVRAFAKAHLPKEIAQVFLSIEAPFVQVIYDITVEQMTFGRVCLLGDAAFVARPHAAAGTAKAAEDGWILAASLDEADTVEQALSIWQSRQLTLGRSVVERTRLIGRRSQVDNTWIPGDPAFLHGLYGPGEP